MTLPGSSDWAGRLRLGEDGHDEGTSVRKLATGIPGFDHVAIGGLPARRATVVAGQSGSAKTVFAAQFLAEGVRRGQPGVFVTAEEPAGDLRENLRTLGWDVPGWEAAGDWRFVDASPLVRAGGGGSATYGFEALAAQIGHAVDATAAQRLVLDSLNAVLSLQEDVATARQLLRTLISSLRAMGLTVVLTVETPGDPGGALSRYGVEEFVADNVVLLRNAREGTFRRRTLEVLKMRGSMHHKGDVGFTIVPGRGMVVLPVTAPSSTADTQAGERLSSGNAGLDRLTHGGLLPGSSALLSGPTGTGKTMLVTQFVADGAAKGERALLVSYEETREQVHANGRVLGHDFDAYEQQGLLHVVSHYPEVASLDDHLLEVKDLVEQHAPARLAIDSLSALERLGSVHAYREYVIGITSFVKTVGLVSLMTAASSDVAGATSVTESHISGLVDTVVVLRHVETGGELKRGILVLKMRGSSHEHQMRELVLGDGRLTVGEPFPGLRGLLAGQPVALG